MMFIAERRTREFRSPSNVRTRAQARIAIEFHRCRVPSFGEVQFSSNDSPALGGATVEAEMFPGRLRSAQTRRPKSDATSRRIRRI